MHRMEPSMTRCEFGAAAAVGLVGSTLARGTGAAPERPASPPAALSCAAGAESPVAVCAVVRGGDEEATDFSSRSRGDAVLQIVGGVPKVRIADKMGTLPRPLRDDLQAAVTLPG